MWCKFGHVPPIIQDGELSLLLERLLGDALSLLFAPEFPAAEVPTLSSLTPHPSLLTPHSSLSPHSLFTISSLSSLAPHPILTHFPLLLTLS